MNPNRIEKWLLLESSGELSRLNRFRLNRALGKHPELAEYRKALVQVTATARRSEATPPPFDPAVILHQARRTRERSIPAGDGFWPTWQPAMAYAAIAVALCMTLIYYARPPHDQPAPVAQQKSAPDILLSWDAPFADDLSDIQMALAEIESDWNADPADLDALAAELLELGESS